MKGGCSGPSAFGGPGAPLQFLAAALVHRAGSVASAGPRLPAAALRRLRDFRSAPWAVVYLPTQKFENMASRISSLVTSPVISPKAPRAS